MAKGQIFNKLSPTTQIIIVVSSFAAVIGIGYLVHRKLKSMEALKGSKNELDAVNKEVGMQKMSPTLTPSQVNIIANDLFAAMNGYGSSVDAVNANIAKLKNNADVLSVISAYGIRELSSGAGNPSPNFKGTLPASLSDELSKGEIAAINKVLAKKGITYRF